MLFINLHQQVDILYVDLVQIYLQQVVLFFKIKYFFFLKIKIKRLVITRILYIGVMLITHIEVVTELVDKFIILLGIFLYIFQ